jgi:hypothetical protein
VDSVPFYAKLQAAPAVKSGRARLVALFGENQATVDQFMAEHNLRFQAIGGANINRAGVSGTPTLVLYASGKSPDTITGILPYDKADALVKRLN